MFEEYLQDSYEFLIEAERQTKDRHMREAQRYFRAAVFYASGAMEAFVNYLADSFAKAERTPSAQTLYLTDSATTFSSSKGLTTKREFHPLENKLRVLILRFAPQFDFESLPWNHFVEFKKLRDSLVHPRETEDERLPDEYKRHVRAGLKATIQIMNLIMKGMSGKPLRRQILDLIPD
jgi:hypothetical protein